MEVTIQQLPPPPFNATGWPWTEESTSPTYHGRDTLPKISIVTPSYNQGQYIETTIRSVLLQNYPNFEYIIIDGGSTDQTIEIIKKYEPWITHWVSEKDKGQTEAINKGFSRITGDIIAWLNSDDYYEPNVFKRLSELFANPDVHIVNAECRMIWADSGLRYIDRSGEVTFERLMRYWRPGYCPPQPAIFFRKNVLDEVGLPNENLVYAMDLELWIKMRLAYPFTYVRETFSNYLVHSNSKTGLSNEFAAFIPEWKSVSQKYLSHLTTLGLIRHYVDYGIYQYKFAKTKLKRRVKKMIGRV